MLTPAIIDLFIKKGGNDFGIRHPLVAEMSKQEISVKRRKTMQKIRILIVDDSAVVRDGLCSVIRAHSDIEIVGHARNGSEAIAEAEKLYPNVILMDAKMPEMDGVAATRHIKKHLPNTKVLLLSAYDSYVKEALAAGVSQYLTKDCRRDDLLNAVRQLGRSSLRGYAFNEVVA